MTPRAREIVTRAAQQHGITVAELLGRSQELRIAHARQQAYAELYALRDPQTEGARYTLPAIGRIFGRDHSTVLHGVRAHARRQQEGA